MDGYVVINTELNTKSFDRKIEKLEDELEGLIEEYDILSNDSSWNTQSEEAIKLREKIEQVNNQLIETRKKQKDLDNNSFGNIKEQVNNIGRGIENITKKVVKWGLAVFGVRSAYNYIRSAMTTLSQYNQQLATDLQYIRFSLATPLQGFIENIIQLVYKLLNYINYIANAWFGINLFQNATTKAFQKQNKAMSGTAKSAKELQKTLAGFDEMNVLQKNGSVGAGGGGGGISGLNTPSLDLSKIQGEIPSWIKWIAENGKQVAIIIGAIGAAILGLKLTNFIAGLLGVTEGLGKFRAGISLALGGMVLMIGEIINMIINWNKMSEAQRNVALGLTVLGGVIASVGLALSTSLSFGASLAITALVGLTAAFVTLIEKNKRDAETTMDAAAATDRLRTAKENLNSTLSAYTSAVKNAEQAAKQLEDVEKKTKLSGEQLYNSVIAGVLNYQKMNKKQREVFEKKKKNKEAQQLLRDETYKYQKAILEEKGAQEQVRATTYSQTKEYDKQFKTLIDGYRSGKNSAKEMVDATTSLMEQMNKSTRKTFVESLPNDIKLAFGKFNEEVMGGRNTIRILSDKTKIDFNEIASSAKTTFTKEMPKSIDKSVNKVDTLATGINSIGRALNNLPKTTNIKINTSGSNTKSKNAKGAIYYPKLASGGIINMPGRGIPLGSAIGGERGAEGVIPLTDSQQMELLGEAIGKYITINANITNNMNGRVISRELQRIQQESNFASNR